MNRFECSNCGNSLKVMPEAAGKSITCRYCGERQIVPRTIADPLDADIPPQPAGKAQPASKVLQPAGKEPAIPAKAPSRFWRALPIYLALAALLVLQVEGRISQWLAAQDLNARVDAIIAELSAAQRQRIRASAARQAAGIASVSSEQKAERMTPTQLWQMYQRDPVGTQAKQMRVQISGEAVAQDRPNSKGLWEVSFDLSLPDPTRAIATKDGARRIQTGGSAKLITCLFDQKVSENGQMTIEGDLGEFARSGAGGTIYLVNCQVVK